MDETPKFSNFEEEARYWRDSAERLKRQRDEAREELSEFYTSSKELEVELETQLQQAEGKATEYRTTCNRLKLELDAEREKNQQLLHDRDRDFENIHKELCQIKHMNSGLMRHVQDLEQKNDDLERAKRMLAVSLGDFEDKLNQEMERNAMLEVELGEKDRLSEMVQRLKDEVRDLRSELRIKATSATSNGEEEDEEEVENNRMAPPPLSPPAAPIGTTGHLRCVCGAVPRPQHSEKKMTDSFSTPEKDSKLATNGDGKAEIENIVPNGVGSPLKGSMPGLANGGSNGLLTPSARISALNIVGDLLRKVGALESKLASCRSYSTESATNSKIPSRMDAQRFGKRIPRGTSSPNVQSLVRAGSTAS